MCLLKYMYLENTSNSFLNIKKKELMCNLVKNLYLNNIEMIVTKHGLGKL